jgi:two-component system sensor histidine kinase KdpD
MAIVVLFRHLLHTNPTTVGFTFLLAVLVVSATWGLRYAVFLAFIATLAYNYFFLPPIGTFTISDPQNWVALVAFLVTALIASELAEKARSEATKSDHRRRELERLYTFSQQLLSSDNVFGLVNAIPRQILDTFGGVAAAMFLADPKKKIYYSDLAAQAMIGRDDLERIADRGEPSTDPEKGLSFAPLRVGVRSVGALALVGADLSRESMEAIGSLLAIAIERAGAVDKLAHAEADREGERLRSVLLDSVTHDFRTPLTAIKASAQSLASDTELDESARKELLTVITEESDRLDRLVGEAAEMAQLDSHGVELHLAPHHIREAIELALDTNKNALARHVVNVHIDDAAPPIRIDLRRIEEVLAQMLDNAAKYSPAGTTITITAETQGRMLVTSVADQGPGIDGIDQGMVFDKFFRGRGQRYSVKGTGMGLAIAKTIVEAHGGTIGLTSQLGHGSVLHFALPLT